MSTAADLARSDLIEALSWVEDMERGRWGVEHATAVLEAHEAHVQAEVAAAFVAWAAKNEIAEPPLDWAWFGEIVRRYSPLHEEHAR